MSGRLSAWAIPVLALLGLADSTYLAVLHWQDEIPPCGGYSGCADVNSSPFAEVFGIPIAAFGAGLYLAILGLAVWRTRAVGTRLIQATMLLYALAVSAATFMVYLTVVELFVLQAICYWCVALAIITFILLALAIGEVRSLGSQPALQ